METTEDPTTTTTSTPREHSGIQQQQLHQRHVYYQMAVALNNMGVTLLQRHWYRSARKTFGSAFLLLKLASTTSFASQQQQATSTSTTRPDWVHVHWTKASQRLCHSTCRTRRRRTVVVDLHVCNRAATSPAAVSYALDHYGRTTSACAIRLEPPQDDNEDDVCCWDKDNGERDNDDDDDNHHHDQQAPARQCYYSPQYFVGLVIVLHNRALACRCQALLQQQVRTKQRNGKEEADDKEEDRTTGSSRTVSATAVPNKRLHQALCLLRMAKAMTEAQLEVLESSSSSHQQEHHHHHDGGEDNIQRNPNDHHHQDEQQQQRCDEDEEEAELLDQASAPDEAESPPTTTISEIRQLNAAAPRIGGTATTSNILQTTEPSVETAATWTPVMAQWTLMRLLILQNMIAVGQQLRSSSSSSGVSSSCTQEERTEWYDEYCRVRSHCLLMDQKEEEQATSSSSLTLMMFGRSMYKDDSLARAA